MELKKYLIALGIAAGSLYTAYWYGKNSNPPVIKEKVVTVDKTHTNTHTTTHTTTKPDGTIDTHSTTSTSTDTTSVSNHDTQTGSKAQSRYKLGVMAEAARFESESLKYSATAATRIIGPWWVDGKYTFKTKEIGLGVSLEF